MAFSAANAKSLMLTNVKNGGGKVRFMFVVMIEHVNLEAQWWFCWLSNTFSMARSLLACWLTYFSTY